MTEYRKGELKRPIEIVRQQAFDELSAVKVSLEVSPVFQEALPPVTTLPKDVLSEAIENSRLALSLVYRSSSLMEFMSRTNSSIEFEPEKSWLEKLKGQFITDYDRRRFSIDIFKTREDPIGEPLLFFWVGSEGRGMTDSDLQSWWDRGSAVKEITYLASLSREKIMEKLLSAVS